MSLSENNTVLDLKGRCDDGNDDSIASPCKAEKAVLKGIEKLKAVPTVSVQVALRKEGEGNIFTFSRSWTVFRSALHLLSGLLALLNITFLVSGDDLVCEDILIGYPDLKHLRIDSNTLQDVIRSTLDGTDCNLLAIRHFLSLRK